jgi:hypothetical protein
MTRFVSQFDLSQVSEYARRNPGGDDEVIASGHTVYGRGWYRLREFLAVCRWKSPRGVPYAKRNKATAVQAATRAALAEATSERARIKALRSLHGVEWPTASVLLHFATPGRYPILDWRALQALGHGRPRPTASASGRSTWPPAWLLPVRRESTCGHAIGLSASGRKNTARRSDHREAGGGSKGRSLFWISWPR